MNKEKRLYKTTQQPFKRKKNSVKTHVEFGILPMKKYIMGGNYQEKCFLGWDHLMHCNKKLVRNGQNVFFLYFKKTTTNKQTYVHMGHPVLTKTNNTYNTTTWYYTLNDEKFFLLYWFSVLYTYRMSKMDLETFFEIVSPIIY